MTQECDYLDAFLDGDLAPGDDAHFAAHLQRCPSCREALDEQQWIDGMLRSPASAQLERPSRSLVRSLDTSLARRRYRSRLTRMMVAAAVLFVACGWVLQNRQSGHPIHRDVADATRPPPVVEQHVSDGGNREPQNHASRRAEFVGGPEVIVVPVESKHPDVTIVRIYPTYLPDFSAQVTFDSTNDGALASPNFNGG